MAHCRFTNTLADLQDCHAHMDEELSPAEQQARAELVKLCQTIAFEEGDA